MKRSAMVLLFLAVAALGQSPPRAVPVPGEVLPSAPVPAAGGPASIAARVLSRSGQFAISGGDPAIRSCVALLAEETKDDLLKISGLKDDWKTMISIVLHGQPGDPLPARSIVFSWYKQEGSYAMRLDQHLARGIEQQRLQRAVTSALLCEQALQKLPASSSDSALLVPPWLVEGLREAISWQQKRSDRRDYEAVFKHGGVYKLNDLFAISEAEYEALDGVMRDAFRIGSGAMVMALLEQPEGKAGFRTLISEAANFGGEISVLLRRCFPELNLSEQSLAKWWMLQGMNMKVADLTESLSIDETEASLEDALKLHFRDAAGVASEKPLHEHWEEFTALPLPLRTETARPTQDSLVRLSYRCFPSFRPVLAEYQLILGELLKPKPPAIATRLIALKESRLTMSQKARHARDYLDWFEITRVRETSGAFEDYLTLKERLKHHADKRQDSISTYLDRMDEIFNRRASKKAR
jgi:hypothetical protein